MKKQIFVAAVTASMLLSSCGDAEKKDEKKACKTPNDIEANCEDVEAITKLEELSSDLSIYSPNDGISYEDYITKNETVLKENEALLKNLENLAKVDSKIKEDYPLSKIFNVQKDIAMCKNLISDMKLFTIETSWGDNDVVVNVKNGTENIITYIGGVMKYLDADGNVLAEDNVGFYSFHFDSELKDGLDAGYEGTSDHGINVDSDKRGMIATVTFDLEELRYPEAEVE